MTARIPAGSVLSAQGPSSGAAFARYGSRPVRANVYIDGFNLYYGAVRKTPFRWLNPVALATQLLPPAYVVQKIKYFTARVSGAADPDAPRRQHAYLSAIQTLPEVEVYFGQFLAKTIWRPIANLPVGGATTHSPVPIMLPEGVHDVSGGSLLTPAKLLAGEYLSKGTRKPRITAHLSDALIVEVHTMEEKGSDVNLASHLINDAWKDAFDVAAVISNDTDLVTPIKIVTTERLKPIYVVCPGRTRMSAPLASVASFRRHLHPSMLAAAQFPDQIPGTSISKPVGW
jgi:hypothetical protein